MKRILVGSLAIGLLLMAFFIGTKQEMTTNEKRSPSTLAMPLRQNATLMPDIFSVVKLPMNLGPALQAGIKVIFSRKEREQLNDAFADRKQIDGATAVLLKDEPSLNRRTERDRLKAVEFLSAAIMSPENPGHDYAVTAVSEVLTADNVFSKKEVAHRKSLAGDKVELFDILLQTDPSVAMDLYEKTRGTSNFKILVFAKGNSEFKRQNQATP